MSGIGNENSAGKRARDLFNGGWYCAESVVRALAEAGDRSVHGMDPLRVQALASGLCSGVSRSNDLCGAVTGAIMGLGLYVGRKAASCSAAPDSDMEYPYALVQEFLELFNSRWPSLTCRGLTGCDFSSPAGRKQFVDEEKGKQCRDVVHFATDTAVDLLRREGHELHPVSGRAQIAGAIAPCGLRCDKCMAFAHGDIARLSRELGERLGSHFGPWAERFSAVNPALGHYAAFRELLDHFASGQCTGCRGSGCLFTACTVGTCAREHDVDFCFQCGEFPCDHHGMPEGLAGRWQANNEAMRDNGLEAYERESAGRPRYPQNPNNTAASKRGRKE